MKMILVINAGSSSIKYKLFDVSTNNVITNGQCEKIGNESGIFSININNQKKVQNLPIPNHQQGIKLILNTLLNEKIISSFNDIVGIGHRVVMGGKKYNSSVIIDQDVLKAIIDYSPLCPLHNPPQATTIKEFMRLIPHAKNVAVFDTSFHTTIPEVNGYAINDEVKKKYGIYRYGMHGISYRYITWRMQKILNKQDVNLVICHLGNGASICAVKNSKSMNTTMGFTPIEGLLMGSRCGDIDPTIPLFLIKQGFSVQQVDNLLNKESGFKGMTGNNDCRDVSILAEKGDKNAKLAIDMFENRVAKYIVTYVNEIGGNLDGIVFTGGIGENSAETILNVVKKLPILSLSCDEKRIFEKYDDYKLVSNNLSKIKIFQVRTNEELMIEQDVKKLLNF